MNDYDYKSYFDGQPEIRLSTLTTDDTAIDIDAYMNNKDITIDGVTSSDRYYINPRDSINISSRGITINSGIAAYVDIDHVDRNIIERDLTELFNLPIANLTKVDTVTTLNPFIKISDNSDVISTKRTLIDIGIWLTKEHIKDIDQYLTENKVSEMFNYHAELSSRLAPYLIFAAAVLEYERDLHNTSSSDRNRIFGELYFLIPTKEDTVSDVIWSIVSNIRHLRYYDMSNKYSTILKILKRISEKKPIHVNGMVSLDNYRLLEMIKLVLEIEDRYMSSEVPDMVFVDRLFKDLSIDCKDALSTEPGAFIKPFTPRLIDSDMFLHKDIYSCSSSINTRLDVIRKVYMEHNKLQKRHKGQSEEERNDKLKAAEEKRARKLAKRNK